MSHAPREQRAAETQPAGQANATTRLRTSPFSHLAELRLVLLQHLQQLRLPLVAQLAGLGLHHLERCALGCAGTREKRDDRDSEACGADACLKSSGESTWSPRVLYPICTSRSLSHGGLGRGGGEVSPHRVLRRLRVANAAARPRASASRRLTRDASRSPPHRAGASSTRASSRRSLSSTTTAPTCCGAATSPTGKVSVVAASLAGLGARARVCDDG